MRAIFLYSVNHGVLRFVTGSWPRPGPLVFKNDLMGDSLLRMNAFSSFVRQNLSRHAKKGKSWVNHPF